MASLGNIIVAFFACFISCCAALSTYELQRIRERAIAQLPREHGSVFVHPIGYVAGEPIWPRTYEERGSSGGELFFDENGGSHLLRPSPRFRSIFRRSGGGGVVGVPKYARFY